MCKDRDRWLLYQDTVREVCYEVWVIASVAMNLSLILLLYVPNVRNLRRRQYGLFNETSLTIMYA